MSVPATTLNSYDDNDKEDEEDTSELEAELYSRIYYEDMPQSDTFPIVLIENKTFSGKSTTMSKYSNDCDKKQKSDSDIALSTPMIEIANEDVVVCDDEEQKSIQAETPLTRSSKFNIDEFLSNTFDKNLCEIENSSSSDSEDDDVLICSPLPAPQEESRYTFTRQDHKPRPFASTAETREDFESSSSDEDEGIQIIREVDVALERSLRAELVDIASSSEVEDINSENTKISTPTMDKISNDSLLNNVRALPQKPGTSPKPTLSRERAQFGRLVIRKEQTGVKRPTHFVAQSDSSSDDSTSSSDGEQIAPIPARLSLNLSGGNLSRDEAATFRQITGSSLVPHLQSQVRYKNWTPEMYELYDDLDPYMADITLEKLLDSIPKTANWSPGVLDRYKSNNNQRRYFNSPNFLNCSICGQRGHRATMCNRHDLDARRCFMCGGENHSKFNCPKMMCLRCGQQGMPYTSNCIKCRHIMSLDCYHCGGRGHEARYCPDHWRRFHLTIEPGNLVVPEITHLDYSKISCPNCSRKGHLVHQCRAFSSSLLPKSIVTVVSYEDSRRQKRRHETDSEIRHESTSASKKRLRMELKEKKRVFRSYPHTPTESSFQSGRSTNKAKKNNHILFSEPVSPGDTHLDLSVFDVTRNLKEAKKRLVELTSTDGTERKNKKSKKRQKRQSLNEEAQKNSQGFKFTKKNHEPRPFPRSNQLRKPRHQPGDIETTGHMKRSKARMLEWKQKRKLQRIRKKNSFVGGGEDFIHI